MNIAKELLKAHSRQQAQKVADYAATNTSRFSQLVDVYLSGPYRITQRASWPLGICAEKKPSLVKPHLKKLLDFLEQPGTHDAVRRNTMRLLQFTEIPKRHHAQVINLCFGYLQDKKIAVAIKAFAMSVLARIIADQPELQQELRVVIEDQLPYASAAFRSRAAKILKESGRKGE